MAGIATRLNVLIKRGELPKVQELLGGIADPAIIADIEQAEMDPVNLAINCRDEQLAIYLVEKGFSTMKLYQSVSERCDQWCLSHHRKGRCPSQYDAADNAASKHFFRLKELVEAIRDGRRKPGDGLISGITNAALVQQSQHLGDKRHNIDRVCTDQLQAPGVSKEKPKSAAMEAVSLLDRYGANYADKEGNTLLHRVSNSTPAHVYVLAHRGVPINIQNNVGDTALHLAVRRNNFDCAEALIQCSADLTIRNGLGQMAIDEAEGPLKEMLEKCRPAFHQARLPCGAIAQTVAWSAPRSMALHSITASQCAFTQPPPADGPAFPPATSRPAVGSGKRPPLIQASCPTSYH
ncbi:hypothetical protein ACOMHN_059887 [Nucella lapillus]